MAATYDIVAMGAGHNGLVAAAYLAKAGKKVLVLERRDHPGGGVVTRELTLPGYHHDVHSSVHIMIQGNPLLTQDELGLLGKFGLKYQNSEVPHVTVFEDQSTLYTYKSLDRTCESIAAISPRDAESYRRFAARSAQLLPLFISGLYAPPISLGNMFGLLEQSEEGREMLDAMMRSTVDITDRLFENDKVKIHFVRLTTENLQMPDELGTGLGLYLFPGLMHSYGVSQPIGGSGKLTESLVRCIEHYGGEVRCNSEVARITMASGRARGVELTNGETFGAKDAVIGAIHPHRLRQYVAGLEQRVLARAEQVTLSTFSLHVSHYALKEKARFICGGDAERAVMVELMSTSKMSEMLQDFDELRRGRIPNRRLVAGGDSSKNDPSRAPPGRGVFYGVTFAPYHLAYGGPSRWDDIKEEVADVSQEFYGRFFSNVNSANILKRTVYSPLDMERSSPNSFVNGDVHGAAPFMYQTGANRPTADLGGLSVPGAERLYLVGPAMHPGGGVFGAGRATAIKIFDDLGIDFERIVSS